MSTRDDLQKQGQFYQALGTVEAVLFPSEAPGRGELVIQEQRFPAWIRSTVLKHLCPGSVQRLRVYPRFQKADNQWSFTVIAVDNRQEGNPGEFCLQGNWLLIRDTPLLQIRQTRKGGRPFYLPLDWSAAPKPDAHFWVLQCQFVQGKMIVQQAEGPCTPPTQVQPQETEFSQLGQLPPSSPKPAEASLASIPNSTSLSIAEIKAMAIPAKVEMTCKFSEVPQHRTVPEGVEFYLTDGDRILTVSLKTKQFNKLLNHGYANWIAVISGQLGAATTTGFELSNASLQVFERKPKAAQAAQTPVEKEVATAQSKPASKTAATKRPLRKGPLRGIEFR